MRQTENNSKLLSTSLLSVSRISRLTNENYILNYTFWEKSLALLERGYRGTYHQVSEKQLDRYVHEFSGRYNDRPFDTIDQTGAIAFNLDGKRLSYQSLVE